MSDRKHLTPSSISHDFDALQQENAALRAEIDRLHRSLSMRAARLVADTSVRNIHKLPGRAVSFLKEVTLVRLWRRVVVGLECGLPEDPLRSITPGPKEAPRLKQLKARIFSRDHASDIGADITSEQDAAGKALLRLKELTNIARSGPDVAPQDRTPPTRELTSRRAALVLHTGEPDTINGYARRSQDLLTSLSDTNWTVDAYLRSRPGADVSVTLAGATYHRLAAFESPGLGYSAYVEAYAEAIYNRLYSSRERAASPFPEIVHAASNHVTGYASALAAERAGATFVYEVRGLWEVTRLSIEPSYEASIGFRAQRMMELATAKKAARLLVNGDALKEYFCKAGIPAERIISAPNGCEPEAFDAVAGDAESLRARWGLDSRPIIGFVGSLTPYEGLEDVLAAVARLSAESCQVLIVGDGPSKDALSALSIRLGIQDRVLFVGRVSAETAKASFILIDIAPIVRPDTAVARLTPPLKPLEALAARCALVVSDVAPLVECARDGRGLVVPPSDVKALARAFERLCGDPEKSRRMAAAGQNWARSTRTWRRSADIILTAYDQAMEDPVGV